jgi:hypothetical protein
LRRTFRKHFGAADVVRAAAVGVRGPDAAGNYRACCPACLSRAGKTDTEFKLTFRTRGEVTIGHGRAARTVVLSPKVAVWNCYRCSWSGLGDLSAIGQVTEDAATDQRPEVRSAFEADLLEVAANSRPIRAVRDATFRTYLQSRGVLEQAVEAGALACTAGKYRGRVVLPIRPAPGRPWQGFSARAIAKTAHIRYLYPRGMDRRSLVWGQQFRSQCPAGEPRWLVEGVFDGLPLVPFGRATLGKNVNEEQIEAIASEGAPVVVCLDGDAWEEARVLCLQFRLRGVPATWCHLPPGTDPGLLGWRVREFVQGPIRV